MPLLSAVPPFVVGVGEGASLPEAGSRAQPRPLWEQRLARGLGPGAWGVVRCGRCASAQPRGGRTLTRTASSGPWDSRVPARARIRVTGSSPSSELWDLGAFSGSPRTHPLPVSHKPHRPAPINLSPLPSFSQPFPAVFSPLGGPLCSQTKFSPARAQDWPRS